MCRTRRPQCAIPNGIAGLAVAREAGSTDRRPSTLSGTNVKRANPRCANA
jgi:hypothetical protein